MVSLAESIAFLYPAADLSPGGNVRVVNDGSGDRIEQWDVALGPQPTAGQLLTASLEVAKAQQRTAINAWRDAEEEEPLTWNGHQWQMRRADREKIMGVALAGLAPPSGYWTDLDDNDVPMTAQDMQALYGAGLARIAAIHVHQRERKVALNALSDPAAVQALDPAEGWAG